MKCGEKISYKNRSNAWRAAAYYFTEFNTVLSVYRCHCKKFHLTSKNRMPIPPNTIKGLNYRNLLMGMLYRKLHSFVGYHSSYEENRKEERTVKVAYICLSVLSLYSFIKLVFVLV